MASNSTSPAREQASPSPGRVGPNHSSHIFNIPHRSANAEDKEPATKEPPSHQEPNDINIAKIPPVQTPATTAQQAPDQQAQQTQQAESVEQAQPHQQVPATGLEGKFVDEFGNILDLDGTVLGRVDGDLPTMIGRPVSASGEVLDTEGHVCGRVSENYELKPLGGGLQVDASGNIYDGTGQVVGKLNDKPSADGTVNHGTASSSQGQHDGTSGQQSSSQQQQQQQQQQTPSPSDIYLDIKSTHDGIQIILKIPTVFSRPQTQE